MKAPLLSGLCLLLALAACRDDEGVKPVAPDSMPPARVTSLAATARADGRIELTWTAPGDDGALGLPVTAYDIRCSRGTLSEATWDSATVVPPPAEQVLAGRTVQLLVSDLAPATWQFALKAADEVPNWSPLSNVSAASLVPDDIAPAAIGDLAASPVEAGIVTLTWTAPGDDDATGTASSYELRWSDTPITAANWAAAAPVADLPSPATAGTRQSAVADGLANGELYFFALRAVDDSDNYSALSNLATTASVGSVVRVFAAAVSGHQTPEWGRDRNRLVLLGPGVYVVAAIGEAAVLITDPDWSTYFRARWSPDGTRLLVARYAGNSWNDQSSNVFVTPAEPFAHEVMLAWVDGGQRIYECAWSPDGHRVVYTTQLAGQSRRDVWVTSVDSGTPALLFDDQEGTGLDWSPDGASLLYSSGQGAHSDIAIQPLDGSAPTRVTDDDAIDREPAWSPDGQEIVFVSNRSGQFDLWHISKDGRNAVQLTDTPAVEGHPSWSPDGHWIAFDRVVPGSPHASGVWAIRVN